MGKLQLLSGALLPLLQCAEEKKIGSPEAQGVPPAAATSPTRPCRRHMVRRPETLTSLGVPASVAAIGSKLPPCHVKLP